MNRILILLAVSSLTLCGRDVRVRQAWARPFKNVAAQKLFSDNLGHLAVAGWSETGSVVVLVNKQGRVVGRQEVADLLLDAAIADRAGRIFIGGDPKTPSDSQVRCAELAPNVRSVLWASNFDLGPVSHPSLVSLNADDSGGVYLVGSFINQIFSSYDPHSYVMNVNGGVQTGFNYYRKGPSAGDAGVASLRASDGGVIVVGTKFSRYANITLVKYFPDVTLVPEWVSDSPTSQVELPNTAQLDGQDNIIVVGTARAAVPSIPLLGVYLTVKVSPTGTVLWRRNGPSGEARQVGTGSDGSILVSGDSGTMKYAADGTLLWTNSIAADALRVDASNNVILAGHENAVAITTKLSPDGTKLWEKQYSPPNAASVFRCLLELDEAGDAVVAIWYDSFNTTLVKYVDKVGKAAR